MILEQGIKLSEKFESEKKISEELTELLKDVNQIPPIELPMSIESNKARIIHDKNLRKAESEMKSDNANHIELDLMKKRTLLSVSGK